MGIDLPLIWAIIIAFGLMMYVTLDGFDLGIGIMFPFVRDRSQRDNMINTIAPVWDGNETWLILGGAGLLAAFPLVYATVLSALYLPLVLMLLGLIWRGVSFEFRFKADEEHKPFWEFAFALGSYTAAFFQGVTLGALINGLKMENGIYVGGAFGWVSPFSLFVGLGLVVAYALLGVTWLIMKTEGELYNRMLVLARPLVQALLVVIGVVSLWTPMSHPEIAARWFSLPNIIYFAPVPGLVLLCGWLMWRSLQGTPNAVPFALTLALLFLGYSGLGISIWPNIIPPDITITQAAGPPQSLGFALVGALLIVPIILVYNAWSYFVFRGKVKAGDHYH